MTDRDNGSDDAPTLVRRLSFAAQWASIEPAFTAQLGRSAAERCKAAFISGAAVMLALFDQYLELAHQWHGKPVLVDLLAHWKYECEGVDLPGCSDRPDMRPISITEQWQLLAPSFAADLAKGGRVAFHGGAAGVLSQLCEFLDIDRHAAGDPFMTRILAQWRRECAAAILPGQA